MNSLLGFGLVCTIVGIVSVTITFRSERARKSAGLRKLLLSFVTDRDYDLEARTFAAGAVLLLIGVFALVSKALGYELVNH
jgi:hypothetical protein